MDLRHYSGKKIDPFLVSQHNYSYYSRGTSSGPILILHVQSNGGTPDMPDYALMLYLNNERFNISQIIRLREVWGTGYYIKKFPPAVDDVAERILASVITDKEIADDAFSQLKDSSL